MITYLVLSLVVSALILGILGKCTRRINAVHYPPGPKGLPILGNLLDMPTSEESWLIASEWKKKYGEMIYLEALGKRVLFLNSYKATTDLMEKHSQVCSSRPSSSMGDLLKWYWFVVFMPYGDKWRSHRRCLHHLLDRDEIVRYHERQEFDARKLLAGLAESPEQFLLHIRRTIASTIMMVTYGHEVEEDEDKDQYVSLAKQYLDLIQEAAIPGAFLVDLIPLLKCIPSWFPGARFQRLANKGYNLSQEMRSKPYNDMKTKVLNGTSRPSMISKLIEENRKEDGMVANEEMFRNVAGVMYAAGAGLTVSSIETFFLAMVLYPEVQKRAHEELDRVIGNDRLPSIQDRESLPYIDAICKELMRWQPVTPLGLPHVLTENVELNGYFIPRDTVVMANIWELLHDSDEYTDPDAFMPERFLPSQNADKKLPRDPCKAAFGFGRRICPGRHMAMNTVFIIVSSVLSAFKFEKATGPDGKPIVPKAQYIPEFSRHPVPFKCAIKPRGDRVINLIHQSLDF